MAWWLEEESSLALRDKRLTRTCFDSWTGYIQFNLRERVEEWLIDVLVYRQRRLALTASASAVATEDTSAFSFVLASST